MTGQDVWSLHGQGVAVRRGVGIKHGGATPQDRCFQCPIVQECQVEFDKRSSAAFDGRDCAEVVRLAAQFQNTMPW